MLKITLNMAIIESCLMSPDKHKNKFFCLETKGKVERKMAVPTNRWGRELLSSH